jgi:hypothetical protein
MAVPPARGCSRRLLHDRDSGGGRVADRREVAWPPAADSFDAAWYVSFILVILHTNVRSGG